MHDNSMKLMKEFVAEYALEDMVAIDIGSQDFNGSYRNLFYAGRYIGVDIVNGANVDVVIGSAVWELLGQVSVIISGQTLEHVADIPEFMENIFAKLKSGGYLCVIAPSAGPEHNYPIWSGHFSAERMSRVVNDAGFEIIECIVSDVEPWRDCRCIARKPYEDQ